MVVVKPVPLLLSTVFAAAFLLQNHASCEQIEKSFLGNLFINLANWLKPSALIQIWRDFMWADWPWCKCRLYGAENALCCALVKFCCPEPRLLIDLSLERKTKSPDADGGGLNSDVDEGDSGEKGSVGHSPPSGQQTFRPTIPLPTQPPLATPAPAPIPIPTPAIAPVF